MSIVYKFNPLPSPPFDMVKGAEVDPLAIYKNGITTTTARIPFGALGIEVQDITSATSGIDFNDKNFTSVGEIYSDEVYVGTDPGTSYLLSVKDSSANFTVGEAHWMRTTSIQNEIIGFNFNFMRNTTQAGTYIGIGINSIVQLEGDENQTSITGLSQTMTIHGDPNFTGICTNAYGVDISFSDEGSGTIANNYGLRIGTMPADFGTSLKYAIYTNNGVVRFGDEVLVSSTNKIAVGDNATYIAQDDDGHLDLHADVSIDFNASVEMGSNTITTTGLGTFGSLYVNAADGLIVHDPATPAHIRMYDSDGIAGTKGCSFIYQTGTGLIIETKKFGEDINFWLFSDIGVGTSHFKITPEDVFRFGAVFPASDIDLSFPSSAHIYWKNTEDYFEFSDDIYVDGTVGIGVSPSATRGLSITGDFATGLNIAGTVTTTTGSQGLSIAQTFTPASSATQYNAASFSYGLDGSADIGTLRGLWSFLLTQTYDGTVDNVYQVHSNPVASIGTYTNMDMFRAEPGLVLAAASTNLIGFHYTGNFSAFTTGGVTNLYGLKIEDITEADTLNYSIHTGLGLVQFGDEVYIGADEDGHDFTVYGDSAGDKVFWDASANQLIVSGGLQGAPVSRTPALDVSGSIRVTRTGTPIQSRYSLSLQDDGAATFLQIVASVTNDEGFFFGEENTGSKAGNPAGVLYSTEGPLTVWVTNENDPGNYGGILYCYADYIEIGNGGLVSPGVGIDYYLEFHGSTNSGRITWMEDEDYFQYSDDILMSTTEKVMFRATTEGIYSQASGYLDVFTGTAFRIGDSSAGAPTNYSSFESDGTLVFTGTATVWEDYVTPLTKANFAGASNDPTSTKLFDDGSGSAGVWSLVFSDGDEVIAAPQMPHGWKEGSDISPHIHFMCLTDVDPTDAFGIEFEYTWADKDEDFPGNTTIATINVDTGVDTANMHQLANVTASPISGAGHTISSILLCRIKRVAATAGDNYAGGVAILDFDVHYEKDMVGSREILVK